MINITMVVEGKEYNLYQYPKLLIELRRMVKHYTENFKCDRCGSSTLLVPFMSEVRDTRLVATKIENKHAYKIERSGVCNYNHVNYVELILGADYLNETLINYCPNPLFCGEPPIRDIMVLKT